MHQNKITALQFIPICMFISADINESPIFHYYASVPITKLTNNLKSKRKINTIFDN